MPWENTGSGTSRSGTARPATGARTRVLLTVVTPSSGRTNNTSVPARRSRVRAFSSKLPHSFSGGVWARGGLPRMSGTTKPEGVQTKSGLHIPGFAQLQRLGKSLMLPIAVLPAAGILLRLGQPDLLGSIKAPVIGDFFKAMSAAGDAIFSN